MNEYEAKKAARIERLRQRSERLQRLAEAGHARARALASVIPFGQPILVGHHSEGRDRRYRDKITKTFARSFEAAKEAETLTARADRAEASTAVSSDDPDAVEKLREKVAAIVAHNEGAKAANKLLRASAHPPSAEVIRAVAALIGWEPERTASYLGALHSMGRRTFSTTNGGAERRRIESRIAQLEARALATPRSDEVVGDIRIAEEENRVRVFFPAKPSGQTRSDLKRGGFRWSPTAGAWQAYPSATAWAVARKAAEVESLGTRAQSEPMVG